MRRSLAAVLAADIVGYSGMMSADAEATLRTLQRLKAEVLNPAIAARRGRIVKSMGDGWIVVFEAVTDAIECAMHMQDRLKIDGAVQMRTGVHIGDIAEADQDVFGEGVNIAARLQEIAEPGALALSDAVYSLLDGTLRPSFDDAGERSLKNIPRPLRVWVRGGALAGQATDLQASDFPRLVIRPVATTDGRAEVQDLAHALTGDFVFLLDAYRGYSARVSELPIAHEYELKTSLRASGTRLRLEAQLIAPDRAGVASRKLDGDLEEVFDWQDQAAGEIAGHTLRAISHNEVNRISALAEDKRTASDWAFLAVSQDLRDLGLDGHLAALQHFEKALALSPDNGFLYAQALAVLTSATGLGFAGMLGPFAGRADTWAAQLDRLEQPHSPARILLIWSQIVGDKSDTEKIRQEVQRLTRQMPFDPELLFWAGWVYLYLGEPAAALECIVRINTKALPLHFEAPLTCQIGFA
ncbi:MAG: adenylate/guanylate cyclase domain-containing protein, partial [Roseobacter sp.]|nr:adenylate/guanylate cyclase domain-containing protein [Roseobacter sp.]